ncbi:MAG: TIM barrel protein [Bacillota bacterium]|jgi:sugar phosphate isomerase/epimerase|nr:TIM barrel protein [Bacillota bacterium]NLV64048.1 sugar phosphate isomerase/epimerase [Clostridiaceae bacterium]
MVKFVLSGFSDEIDKDLNIQISELKRNNINHMEIRGVYGKGIVEYTINEVKEIKKLLDSEGISVSSVGSPIGKISITDRFKAHLDLFKHTLEIAGILSSNYIRLFSFYIPEGGNPADFRDEVLERFNSFTEAAKGTGIILAHENEKGIYGDTAERCVDIIESMNCSYVKAVFDPANFIQCGVETYPKAYSMLKPHIEYMHIKDALFDSGKVVPAGMGNGKIKEILSDINVSFNREMFLSLEPHLGSFEGLEALETDIDISSMGKGGPAKFAAAVKALRKVMKESGI